MTDDGTILTFTGKRINPLAPDPELIDPLDIAHALACCNRYTGHAFVPFSVAQHSCLVYDYVYKDKLWALLHDASEAFLSDLARPVKIQEQMSFYIEAERILMNAIAQKFNLIMPIPLKIKEADDILLHTEMRDFFGVSPNGHTVLKELIKPWDWRTSKLNFIRRLQEQGIGVGSIVV